MDYSAMLLDRLSARFEIQDAIYRWARAVDRRDWTLIETVFHPDAYDEHGMYRGNIEGLVAWLDERHKAIEQSMHHVGNIIIEFDGGDGAVVESYVVAYQRYRAGDKALQTSRVQAMGEEIAALDVPVDAVMAARYVDHFVRRNNVWRILRRTTVFETRNLHPIFDESPMNPSWVIQRRDQFDTLWQARREFLGENKG